MVGLEVGGLIRDPAVRDGMAVVRNDAIGDVVQRAIGRHLDVVRHGFAARLDRHDGIAVRGMLDAEVTQHGRFEILGGDDDVRQLTVLLGEVAGGAVHSVHLPVDAVEVEIADAPGGEDLMHLERDRLRDQPLAHVAFGRARAPHPVRGDRTSAVAGPGIVACSRRRDRLRDLPCFPVAVVDEEPLNALLHRGHTGARQMRIHLMHA